MSDIEPTAVPPTDVTSEASVPAESASSPIEAAPAESAATDSTAIAAESPSTPEPGTSGETVASTGDAKAKEPVGKRAAKGAAAGKPGDRKKKRPRREVGDERVVAPTPEELAGIPSDAVRAAVEAGHPVEGTVIGWNLGGFHVAVDGISAFCPRSSMELTAPHEPAQYIDKKLAFRVLRVEEKGRRLVLSRAAILREEKKQHAEETRRKLTVGLVVHGKVVALTDFGAFVDLGGIEGLIHVSEIKRERVAHPKDALAIGQAVEAKVVKLPKGTERVSLSIKALEPDPWDGVIERFPIAQKVPGKILRKSEFGFFVEVAPGVEGLLHVSQLPPGAKAEDPQFASGTSLELWVREVDPVRKRISLAAREVPTSNPWQGAESKYPEGTVVTGKVEKIAPFGAFVELEPGLSALLPTSEMGLPKGAAVGRAYKLGKEVKLKVASIDVRKKRISLTREDKTLEGSKADYNAYQREARKSGGMGALAAALSKIRQPGG